MDDDLCTLSDSEITVPRRSSGHPRISGGNLQVGSGNFQVTTRVDINARSVEGEPEDEFRRKPEVVTQEQPKEPKSKLVCTKTPMESLTGSTIESKILLDKAVQESLMFSPADDRKPGLISKKSVLRRTRANWKFHRMLFWWVILTYCVANFLTMIGLVMGTRELAAYIFRPTHHDAVLEREAAFIKYPVYIGTVIFLGGTYFGWFRLVNSNYQGKNRRIWFWSRSVRTKTMKDKVRLSKAMFYLLGSLLHAVNSVQLMILGWTHQAANDYIIESILPDSIGALMDICGAFLELTLLDKILNPRSVTCWAVWINFISCILIEVGIASGFFISYMSQDFSDNLVTITLLIARSGFMLNSWVCLIEFKREQWIFHYETNEGKIDIWDQAFIVLYIYNLSLSVITFIYSLDRHDIRDAFMVVFCFLGIWMHVLLLHLSNVTAGEQLNKPWTCVKVSFRILVVLYSTAVTLLFMNWYDPFRYHFI